MASQKIAPNDGIAAMAQATRPVVLSRPEITLNHRYGPVPASFFSIVLGLAGLGNAWRLASSSWGLPHLIGEGILLFTALVWAALLVLYVRKWLHEREAALAEIAHPIQCCFLALIPVTTLLMGAAVLPYSRAAATLLCLVGGIGALAFGIWRHGGLWRGGRNVNSTTPVLYLPIVAANLVSAIAVSALGWPELGQLFFGAGVLAWLALESIIVSRLLTAEELPQALRPTLGIQLAPPAVALLAYAGITTGAPDLLAHMLLGYALVQALLAIRLMPWIQQPFTPGYWAFTFGATALASGAIRFADRGTDKIFLWLSPLLFTAANLIVVGLALYTVMALVRGKLLPPHPASPRVQ